MCHFVRPFIFCILMTLITVTACVSARAESDPHGKIREAAESGDASAQMTIGDIFLHGEGVSKDDVEAVKWYRKAAEQGEARAQMNLGMMYAEGRGVSRSELKAVWWSHKAAKQFHRAAERGDATSQYYLGRMYIDGRGSKSLLAALFFPLSPDESEALKWYRKAAEQGQARAQTSLGWKYAEGRGVAKDESEAVSWFRKAAEQGNAEGQQCLGSLYAKGMGVPKDDFRAAQWYRKAADKGNAKALLALDQMDHEGRIGVHLSLELGQAYLEGSFIPIPKRGVISVRGTIRNNLDHNISDIRISCRHYGHSGTDITEILDPMSETIYETWRPGETRRIEFEISDVRQRHRTECKVKDWRN